MHLPQELATVLEAVSTPCLARHADQLWSHLSLTCHTGSWSAAKLANNSHVGKYSAGDRMRRARVLLADRIANDNLMRLEKLLGYAPDEAFAGMTKLR